jgi:hypothetical protein
MRKRKDAGAILLIFARPLTGNSPARKKQEIRTILLICTRTLTEKDKKWELFCCLQGLGHQPSFLVGAGN